MNSHIQLTEVLHLFVKLQRNVEINALFCMHVIRDRTDQLDNKDMLKNLLKETNNVETILDSFRCSYCIYHLKTFNCS